MGKAVPYIVQQFTDKSSVTDCTIDELQLLVKRYPYFAPARFALLQKLRELHDEPDYAVEYQKAVLFYPNPLQFSHFINAFDYRFEKEPVVASTVSTLLPVASEEVSFDDTPAERLNETSFTATDSISPQIVTDNSTSLRETTASADHTDVDEIDSVEEMADSTVAVEALNVEAALDLPVASEPPKAPEAASGVSQDLTFEPYHTVDYFASQGIKVTADDLSQDKFGKQLRSFTEWLRTMKRLSPSETAPSGANAAEQKVETLAGASVSDAEVVTESMAEVWAKQGAVEKATVIYQKLSLLNPAKAAYFAAKIASLKQPS